VSDIRYSPARYLAATWTATNPVLYAGEMGLETDTGKFKFGDGSSHWNTLSYSGGGGGGSSSFIGLSDVPAAFTGAGLKFVRVNAGATALEFFTLAFTGDISLAALVATIANDAVSNAKLANVPTATFKGRTTAGTGDPEDLTLSQARTLLAISLTSDVGGTLQAAQAPAFTGGDVTSAAGSLTLTIAGHAVSLAKMAQVATATFLGRKTAATGDVEAMTGTQATSLLDAFTSALPGLAPASGGGTTKFLRADGTWVVPAGANTVLSGTGAPGGGTGINGDYYIDTSAPGFMIYGPKAAGAWPAGVRIAFPAKTILTKTANYTLTNTEFAGNVFLIGDKTTALTLTLNTGLTGIEALNCVQYNTGQLIVTGTATFRYESGNKTRARYSVMGIMPIGVDEYLIYGGTTP